MAAVTRRDSCLPLARDRALTQTQSTPGDRICGAQVNTDASVFPSTQSRNRDAQRLGGLSDGYKPAQLAHVCVELYTSFVNCSSLDLRQLQRQIHLSALEIDRGRQFKAAAGLAFGPMLIADGLNEFGVLLEIEATGGNWSDADHWLALQRALDVAGGTGLTIYGSAYAVSRFAGTPTQGTAFRAGRIAGAGGVVLIGASQAVSVYRYARGDITGREFWTAQGVNVGAFAIARVGSWLGGIGGTAFGPGGTTTGVLVGSTIGALVGPPVAARFADLYYVLTQREYDLLFGEKLYAKHGVF